MLETGRKGEAPHGGLHVFVRDVFARNLTGHVLFNGSFGLIECVLGDVADGDLVSCERAHMRDTISHLSGANDANFTEFSHALSRT